MPSADELLGSGVVRSLAACLAKSSDGRSFAAVAASARSLGELGLSDRARLVRDALLADVPGGWPELAAVVRPALADPAFTGWMIWPVSEAVATRATDPTAPATAFEEGLAMLAELTSRLTGEFAIRTFLSAELDRTLAAVMGWTRHADEHVRRLATEGTRPRLPWARRVPAISADPGCTVAVLDELYRDESEYVRRSVANHLNDISRADPALAVDVAARWLGAPDANTARLVRHAMRTLIKAADPGALALLGFAPPVDLVVSGPHLSTQTVPIGGSFAFEIAVHNGGAEPVRVVIDYVVHYRKAKGALAPKVFKLATRTLAAGETYAVTRSHAFVELSTRRHHPGGHAIELQVNGQTFGHVAFEVT